MTRFDQLDLKDSVLTFYDGSSFTSPVLRNITGSQTSINLKTTGSNLYVNYNK